MTVYPDVLFFINFVYDAEIMLVILKLFSKKIPLLRLVLSICLGGLWSTCVFVPYFRLLYLPPMRLLVPLAMTAVVFFPCEKSELFKAWAAFLAISFVFGGAVNFFKLNVAGGAMLLLPLYICIVILRGTLKKRHFETVIVYRGKSVSVKGFWDSGNTASYMGHPLILASSDVFCRLFGEHFMIESISEWVEAKDIRFVPYKSLGGAGIITGIKADYVIINKKIYYDVIVGCCGDKLSEEVILNGSMM
ncbi:MAG: sigma-E processing peptidase SpoIIGA [Firmicutes bacterium]|nr:sigma-E processing peptidase SpoIIGA [Bacillota bacterium]